MPYIKGEERRHQLRGNPYLALDPGELNFVITTEILRNEDLDQMQRIIWDFIDAYLAKNGRRYTTYNEVIGVLECARLEFMRRKAVNPNVYSPIAGMLQETKQRFYFMEIAPYEARKIRENGDVY